MERTQSDAFGSEALSGQSSSSTFRNMAIGHSEDSYNFHKKKHGLSVWGATLAFISTIIGGGIVGLPFSFSQAGIPLGIGLNILASVVTVYSCRLLFITKDMTGGLETYSELGFVLLGPRSIIFVNFIIFLSSFGLIMIYFIVFGNIFASFIRDADITDIPFFLSRAPYILGLGLMVLPFILKKQIHELSIASWMLFFSIFAFIIIFILQLAFRGTFENSDTNYEDYLKVKFDSGLINGIAIILVAFGFQQNVFPTYQSMKERNYENGMKSIKLSCFISMLIYCLLGILSLFIFGGVIGDDILDNVDEEKDYWESYILRGLFMIVLACHIPFIFFSGKEAMLIIIDEFDRSSQSEAMKEKFGVNFRASVLKRKVNKESLDHQAAHPYLTMRPTLYYIGTLSIYILELLGSIFILNIGTIFGFVSAFSISMIAFTLPGLFFFSALRKFGTQLERDEYKVDNIMSVFFMIMGVILFFFLNVGNIMNLVNIPDNQQVQ